MSVYIGSYSQEQTDTVFRREGQGQQMRFVSLNIGNLTGKSSNGRHRNRHPCLQEISWIVGKPKGKARNMGRCMQVVTSVLTSSGEVIATSELIIHRQYRGCFNQG